MSRQDPFMRPKGVRAVFLSFAILVGLPNLVSPQGADPVLTLELEDFDGDAGILATVDGKERNLDFESRWPDSYLVGGMGKVSPVVVQGKELLKATFESVKQDEMAEGADGVLGMDSLRKVCLAFDPLYEKVDVMPHTKIGLEEAKRYFARFPAWGGESKVVRLPLGRAKDGTPTLETTIGAKKTSVVITVSTYNSLLDESIGKPPLIVAKDEWATLPNVAFPGLSPRWINYGLDEDWDAEEEGAHGMIAFDAFLSRRVVIDFADDAMYVEELPESARLSLFFSNKAKMPIAVEGDVAKIGPLPGLIADDQVGPLNGSKLTKIADIPMAEWLRDLRSGTPEATERLMKRFQRFDDDFDIIVVGPTGEERKITIPRRERPEDTSLGGPGGWLRAGAQALAASRSR